MAQIALAHAAASAFEALPFVALATEVTILGAAAGVCGYGLHVAERAGRRFTAADGLRCGAGGAVLGALPGVALFSALGVPLLSGLTAGVWAAALGQGALVGVGAWRLGEWAAAGAERDRRLKPNESGDGT